MLALQSCLYRFKCHCERGSPVTYIYTSPYGYPKKKQQKQFVDELLVTLPISCQL